jgi:hypothetical protein
VYFTNYQVIKEKLRSRTLSDRESLPYWIVFCGATASLPLFPSLNNYNVWDWIGGGLFVLLTVMGVFYAYFKNGGKNGHDIILKYVVLGWIVFFRCYLRFIPIGMALFLAGEKLGIIIDETGWYDTLIFACFNAICYQRIGRHIADTKMQ